MTASTLSHTAGTRARFSPVMVAIIAVAAFASGLGLSTVLPRTAASTGANAQPTFDAVKFRAEERQR